MAREVSTTVYRYAELSDKAKEQAREELNIMVSEHGIITEAISECLTEWLNEWGWDTEPGDLEFRLAYAQGDFAAFSGTRTWDFNGTEYTVTARIRHWGPSVPTIDVEIVDPELPEDFAEAHKIENAAEEMVSEHRSKIESLMSEVDESYDDEGCLSDFAEANDIEFRESGTIFHG